jgi:hypothetical protein
MSPVTRLSRSPCLTNASLHLLTITIIDHRIPHTRINHTIPAYQTDLHLYRLCKPLDLVASLQTSNAHEWRAFTLVPLPRIRDDALDILSARISSYAHASYSRSIAPTLHPSLTSFRTPPRAPILEQDLDSRRVFGIAFVTLRQTYG